MAKYKEDGLVSVIITTYRREMQILKRAIDSVCNQTYGEIEIIVVNDYPKFRIDIEHLVSEYKNVRLINHSENLGACGSRNDGILESKGNYIAFLDDDDEWLPDKIEKQLSKLVEENADMIYCTCKYILPDGTIKGNNYICDCPNNITERLLYINFIGGCSFPLLKKQVIVDAGMFDRNMPSCQDLDLWIRISERGKKIIFLNEQLVNYYLQSDSITSNPYKREKGYYLLMKKHKKLYNAYPKSACKMYMNISYVGYENKIVRIIAKAAFRSFVIFPYNIPVLKRALNQLFRLMKGE